MEAASNVRIAIITGGNKGIGYAIAKGLAALPNYKVIFLIYFTTINL